MECPQCHAENVANAAFCDECGARLESRCANCGESNRLGARYCNQCGASLASGGIELETSAEAPWGYTPEYLADKILTSREALEGERKLVTNLFADLKGSMELLADRDPEEAHALLDPVVERMMDAVHRYEGTVNEVRGDGIMAIFGAPVAHEDHAQRACYAALEMQASIRRYADEVIRTHGVKARIRIGLNSGEVVVRAIGSDLRMDYATVGQTTHLAARMEQLADPGSTLLTANTLRLTEGYIEVKALGPVPVKGLSAPVEVYELLGAGPIRSRLRAAVARGLSLFVGRDAELEQMHRALEQARSAHGEVVAIVGEAGVGKSRLVWELIHSRPTEGWLVIQAGSVSYGKATPYLPIVDLLEEYFQIDSHDDHRTVREKLTGKLLTLDRTFEPILPPLLALLDVPVADDRWNALGAGERRQRTLEAVKRILLRESEVQPLLVVFEDLHWIDSETQALIDSMVESVPTSRVLLMVNYRPGYEHRWGAKTYYTQLGLEPLPPASAAALLNALLGSDASLGPVKRLLIERTGGNPFFLEESVRSLAETRALVGEPGAYRTDVPGDILSIPSTVHAVLAARIDRLSPPAKHLLATAAVIGKVVPLALLQTVSDLDELALRRSLAQLQETEFLYETALYPELEYTFKHALTQEVAYGTLLTEQRRELHAQIVGAIERVYADRLAEQVERLAHHSFWGELWEKAVGFLREAGAKSAGRCTYPEAVGYLEQALVALGHLSETHESLQEAIDLRFALRSALQALGEHERVFKHLREAEVLAATLGDQDRHGWALAYLSQYLWRMDDPSRAAQSGERALAIASALDDFALHVVAHFFMGQGYFNIGDYSCAIKHCARSASALVREHRYDRLGLTGLPSVLSNTFLGWSHAELGQFEEAVACAEKAIDLGDAVNHPYDMAAGYLALGHIQLLRGQLDDAIPTLETAVGLCRSGGLSVTLPTATAVLGLAYALRGRVEESLVLMEEGETGIPESRILIFDTSTANIAPATVHLVAGRVAEAARSATRASERSAARGFRGNEAWISIVQAEIANVCVPTDRDERETRYKRAQQLADEGGMRPLAAHTHCGLGELYRETGDMKLAEEHSLRAHTLFREMNMTPWLTRAHIRPTAPIDR